MTLARDETAFFGRERELSDIERRFAGGARLVTIVGAGGVGKTRLAAVTAARAARAVHASLGESRSLEAAVRAVASAAGVPLRAESQARAALDVVAIALAKRGALLLVLDNTEQLGSAARELASGLLDGARDLSILVTAREALGARAEEKLVLAPLADDEAVALLHDRARAVAGSPVAMTDADALAIVRRVDRLPLAIELAASRLEVLSPPALLARLADRLDVLADATGAAPAAHRTMRATLDWSWDLLTEVERSALAQTSVFAAPFGIDAAEEVLLVDGAEVLDALEGLVKRSLLVRVAGADGRVRLASFETVRAWAREKLDDRAAEALRARHARHHLGEAERSAARAYGDRATDALDALAELLPELLAAFDATKARAPETAARIVLALSDLLLFRSLFELRSELFAAGAEAAERAGDPRLFARALVAKARVTLEEGRIADAETELRRALELASSAGDDVTRAEATRSLGWALSALGRTDEAEAAIAAAAAAHRAQGSPRGLADSHVALGILRALQGRPAEGLAALREALAIHVEHGDVIRQEKVLGFGGLVGHDARALARGLPREVLARAPRSSLDVIPAHVAELVRGEGEAGQRWQAAIELHRQGAAALERRDPDAAVALFDRAVAALEHAGVKRGLAAVHAHAAAALATAGDPEEARARLERARAAVHDDPDAELVVAVFAAAAALLAGEATTAEAARTLLERAARAEIGSPALTVAARVLEAALSEHATPARVERDAASASAAGPALVVGHESRWIVPPRRERVDLVRYGPVRRLLERLVAARLAEPGVALSAEALIEAGWPGERMRHTAGLLRVYSAVRRLRRLGLDAILITRDDGYLLDADAVVRRDDDA
ncbi:MAG: hypothetical protein KF764_12780 [Labilithrix sp.]|nr:hypothetical protein [Labilithrix sp.]